MAAVKRRMLGLAARVAERGLAACVFDIRGHGEHPAPLDAAMLEDLEAILTFLRRFGRVAAAGHSLGGRLALMSSADAVAAISQHQHRGGELPANLLAYLPRWFNHIDLKANAELYVKVPGWLAGRLGGRPE
jgi:dienelactone hydrolase